MTVIQTVTKCTLSALEAESDAMVVTGVGEDGEWKSLFKWIEKKLLIFKATLEGFKCKGKSYFEG